MGGEHWMLSTLTNKAFNIVSHNILESRLGHYDLEG